MLIHFDDAVIGSDRRRAAAAKLSQRRVAANGGTLGLQLLSIRSYKLIVSSGSAEKGNDGSSSAAVARYLEKLTAALKCRANSRWIMKLQIDDDNSGRLQRL